MADDGHTINVGPVTIGEPPARPPVDTDIIGTVALVWRANGADATADAIESLCDEVDRLRAENTALAAALNDHADALADLIDAARNVAADVDPAVTGNALRDALDALDREAPA